MLQQNKKTKGHSPDKNSNKESIVESQILTPLGPMLAAASEKGICLLEFVGRIRADIQIATVKRKFKSELVPGKSLYFDQLQQEMTEYFEGMRKEFQVPLDVPGTDFQMQVWDALLTIPYGKTRTYSGQAEFINRPKAIRAVAKANGDNRISIIIPCHRVIGKNGSLVGYGGGLWRKEYLLKQEKNNCQS